MRPRKPRKRLAKHRAAPASVQPAFTEPGLRKARERQEEYTINDPKTPGLSVKVTPNGRKVFLFRYRTDTGRQRKLTLGTYPDLSIADARRLAHSNRKDVFEGGDPVDTRLARRKSVSVAEFIDRYLEDQAKPRLAPSTYREYVRVLKTRVQPRIGRLALVELTRADVEALHSSMVATPVRANRMLAVVKAMLFKAEHWGLIPRGSNPAARVPMNKENPAQRYFTDAQQEAIFEAIETAREEMLKSGPALNAITFLFYTGCRPSEALNLRWEDIDMDAGLARLHKTKTGEGRLPLARPAVVFLQSIAPEPRNGWVFTGMAPGERLKSLTRPWARVRELAGLPNSCMKDIRHTVGTYVAKEGGLFSAQVVLRHTSPKTTLRYAHPYEASVRGHLESAMKQIDNNRDTAKSTAVKRRSVIGRADSGEPPEEIQS